MRSQRVLTARKGLWDRLRHPALQMRANPTAAEEALWRKLRRNLSGKKFRRQHVIDRYIVDFLCVPANLIIEVDGPIHLSQVEDDANREAALGRLGYRIIRFTNEQVLEHMAQVLTEIRRHIDP